MGTASNTISTPKTDYIEYLQSPGWLFLSLCAWVGDMRTLGWEGSSIIKDVPYWDRPLSINSSSNLLLQSQPALVSKHNAMAGRLALQCYLYNTGLFDDNLILTPSPYSCTHPRPPWAHVMFGKTQLQSKPFAGNWNTTMAYVITAPPTWNETICRLHRHE